MAVVEMGAVDSAAARWVAVATVAADSGAAGARRGQVAVATAEMLEAAVAPPALRSAAVMAALLVALKGGAWGAAMAAAARAAAAEEKVARTVRG
jgi:hypothetical protein